MLPILIVLMLAIGLLAIEWGRVRLHHSHLQAAADAVAQYVAYGLVDGTWAARRDQAVLDHATLGRRLVASEYGVTTGRWDAATRTFTPGAGSPRAVRVVLTAGLEMPLASLFGVPRTTASASAVAANLSTPGAGIVGLDNVSLSGTPRVDSYRPAEGPYALTRRSGAVVASNGPITLSGVPTIFGSAHPGPGHTAVGGTVTGSRDQRATTLTYTPVAASELSAPNDNYHIASHLDSSGNLRLTGQDTLTLPAGRYVVRDLELAGQSQIVTQGAVTLLVTGGVSIRGGVESHANLPSNLNIRVASSQPVELAGNSSFTAHIYAPQSAVDIAGTASYFGTFIGRTLTIRGTADVHHDESSTPSARRVSLVR